MIEKRKPRGAKLQDGMRAAERTSNARDSMVEVELASHDSSGVKERYKYG